ncbi:hypothetical protein C1H71_01655 [Iodobacter fluviatilis]|jgi:hypothetical protein|uniref:Uncharacterized protein n=1 Tax=Iodobacter fluviatilis TaxID=537 RepID=A0A7G3G5A7_9NEIS|nr:hypothetical protein C1H71_01655 [Iodobacter fluviatilis]
MAVGKTVGIGVTVTTGETGVGETLSAEPPPPPPQAVKPIKTNNHKYRKVGFIQPAPYSHPNTP